MESPRGSSHGTRPSEFRTASALQGPARLAPYPHPAPRTSHGGAVVYHPQPFNSTASATMGAMSARNVRGPSDRNSALDARARSNSSADQPPSGPTKSVADDGGDMAAAGAPTRGSCAGSTAMMRTSLIASSSTAS